MLIIGSLQAVAEHTGLGPDSPGGPAQWLLARLLIAGLLVTTAMSLATLAVRSLFRRDNARCGPAYRRLARALGLNFAQRRLLRAVAQHGDVPCPASLLLSRGCFNAAVSRYAASLGQTGQLAALGRALFDEPG